jgi:hypothetical protein
LHLLLALEILDIMLAEEAEAEAPTVAVMVVVLEDLAVEEEVIKEEVQHLVYLDNLTQAAAVEELVDGVT